LSGQINGLMKSLSFEWPPLLLTPSPGPSTLIKFARMTIPPIADFSSWLASYPELVHRKLPLPETTTSTGTRCNSRHGEPHSSKTCSRPKITGGKEVGAELQPEHIPQSVHHRPRTGKIALEKWNPYYNKYPKLFS